MKADARVQFPQASAPTDESLARAVISFADALARGDSDKLRPMLDPAGKAVLDNLLKTGGWSSSTGKAIEAVRVSGITQSGEQATVVLALQEPGVAYPLAWNVANIGGNLVFIAATAPNVTRSRASDFDDPSALTEPVATVASGDLTTQVAAIFKRSCYECHGATKQKGKLRLDNFATLASGDKTLPSGAPVGKELLRRLTLPKDDEDGMPKKGERLSPQDIETIRKALESIGIGTGAGSGASSGGTENPSAPAPTPTKEQPPGTKRRNTPNGPVNVPSGPQPEQKPGG